MNVSAGDGRDAMNKREASLAVAVAHQVGEKTNLRRSYRKMKPLYFY